MEAIEMKDVWKIADTLRAHKDSGEISRELARIALVRGELEERGRFPLANKKPTKIAEEFLSIANDPGNSEKWGYSNFFCLGSEEVLSIIEDVATFDEREMKQYLLSNLHRGARQIGFFDFPAALFFQSFADFNISQGDVVLVPTVENCLSLVSKLAEENPKSRFICYCNQKEVLGIVKFLFSKLKNIEILVGGFERDFSKALPECDLILHFGSWSPNLDKDAQEEAHRRNFARGSSTSGFFISRYLSETRYGCVLYSHVTESLLFSKGDEELRERLLDKSSINAITQLPEGALLPLTQVKSNLIKVTKGAQKKCEPVEVVQLKLAGRIKVGDEFDESKLKIKKQDISLDDLRGLSSWSVDRLIAEKLSLFGGSVNLSRLGEILTDSFRGAPLSSKEKQPDEKLVRVRTINISDLDRFILNASALQPLEAATKRPLNRYFAQEGDILVSSRGSKGASIKIAVLTSTSDIPVVPSANVSVLRVDTSKADPLFIAEFLKTKAGQILLQSRQAGTTLLLLSLKDLGSIEMPLPPLQEQKSIAKKIEKARKAYENKIRLAKAELEEVEEEVREAMGVLL